MPKAAQIEILFSSYSVEMDLLEGPYLGLILFYYEVRNDRKESKERKEKESKMISVKLENKSFLFTR